MRISLDEPQVVERTHLFLVNRGVSRLFTDSHDSLRGRPALEPYQRFTVDLGDFVVHPDLVALEPDGETLVAVEAKGHGHREAVQGLSQAELYQVAFHRTYLAIDSASIGERLSSLARLKNIGLLAVSDAVLVVHEPDARMPLRDAHRAVLRQMETVQQVAERPAFSLNIPTHYLVWTIVFQPDRDYARSDARSSLGPYPIQDISGAIRGARSLGLVQQLGETLRLTDIGAAVKGLLPDDIAEWTGIHRRAASPNRWETMATVCPAAGAVLRILLFQNAIVRLLVDGLRLGGGKANLLDLAAACDRLDHARAPVLFLVPNALDELQDERGVIAWTRAAGDAFRPTISFQLKSVLKHAGILAADVRLGGGQHVDPLADQWQIS